MCVLLQMHAFAEEFERFGLTEKWLLKEAKIQIRNQAIRTRANTAYSTYVRGRLKDPVVGPVQRKIDDLLRVQFPYSEEELAQQGSEAPESAEGMRLSKGHE